MFKKIFYSLTILAMLFGMFGVMGKGGVQTAQAFDTGVNYDDAYQAGAAAIYNLGVGGPPGTPGSSLGRNLVLATRVPADPTNCLAGDQTLWFRFDTTASGVPATEMRFITVAVRATFDAAVVITNNTGPATRIVLGCFNVAEDSVNILTLPFVPNANFNVMVAERQGYPYAGEAFDIFAMESRNAAPVITQFVFPGVPNTPRVVRTADGSLPTFGAWTVAAPDANDASFFDLPAGDYNISWSDNLLINFAMFRSVTAPALARFTLTNADTMVTVYSDGGTNPYALWITPSDWVAGSGNLLAPLRQGIDVVGCQGIAPDPAGLCVFFVEDGTYDAELAVFAGTPYYDLVILGKALTHPAPWGEQLDFRATSLPQGTIQLNSENIGGIDAVNVVLRGSDALGDLWHFLADEDQLIVSANIAESIEVRLTESGWIYVLDPVLYAGLGAISRTFTPGEEVNIQLDSGNYLFGVGVAPYDFYTSIDFSGTAPATISMTNWVDVVGNVLIRVAAPDNTLLPVDPTEILMDEILPNTLVTYGVLDDVLSDLWTWATTPISIASPVIGRYHAQRVLLHGLDVDTGVAVFYTPVYPAIGFVEEGAQDIFAVSPTDVPMGGHWSWSWVEAMYELGLTNGISAGLYGPDVVMTRAQMAAFLSRSMVDLYLLAPMTSTAFSDVPATNFAAADIANLRGYNITAGCGGNNYCPDAAVTRAEMAKFIELTFRTIEVYAPGSVGGWVDQDIFSPGFTFIDVPAEHWANIWIEELFWDGMTSGCTRDNLNLYFCPEDTVTRGQMAKFITSAIFGGPGAVQTFWPILAPER